MVRCRGPCELRGSSPIRCKRRSPASRPISVKTPSSCTHGKIRPRRPLGLVRPDQGRSDCRGRRQGRRQTGESRGCRKPVAVKSKGIGPLPPNARPGPAVTESGTAHELIPSAATNSRRSAERWRPTSNAFPAIRPPWGAGGSGSSRRKSIQTSSGSCWRRFPPRPTTDQLDEDEWLEKTLRVEIARGIVTADPWQVAESAKVQCLVGPTGVGENNDHRQARCQLFAFLGGKRLALVTADTYRIAAVEQLKTYAEIIGVPPGRGPSHPQELKAAIEQRSGLRHDPGRHRGPQPKAQDANARGCTRLWTCSKIPGPLGAQRHHQGCGICWTSSNALASSRSDTSS